MKTLKNRGHTTPLDRKKMSDNNYFLRKRKHSHQLNI